MTYTALRCNAGFAWRAFRTESRQEKLPGDKGGFSLLVLDASVKYRIHIEKEHVLPLDETVTPLVNDTLRISFTLQPDANTP